jgi:hypothetical protein
MIASFLQENPKGTATLYAMPGHRATFDHLQRTGYVEAQNAIVGRFYPNFATDLAVAIPECDLINIAGPCGVPEEIFRELEKYDLSQKMLNVVSANFLWPIAQRLHVKFYTETATSPQNARITGNKVYIGDNKRSLPMASSSPDESLRAKVASLFSMPIEWKTDFLHLGFMIVSGLAHIPIVLGNLGRENYLFYAEGGTVEGVPDRMRAVFQEVRDLAADYGYFDIPTEIQVFNKYYGTNFPDIETFFDRTRDIHFARDAPDRYFIQGQFDLVPMVGLAEVVGRPLPEVRSLLDGASKLYNERYSGNVDFMKTGRTLKKLGLKSGASKQDVFHLFGGK